MAQLCAIQPAQLIAAGFSQASPASWCVTWLLNVPGWPHANIPQLVPWFNRGLCCDNSFLLFVCPCQPGGWPGFLPVISHGSLRIPNGSKNAHAYVHFSSLDLHFKICNVSRPKQTSPWGQSQRTDGKTILVIVSIHKACILSRFSCVQLFETLWTVSRQAYLAMGFPRQEYWNGLPFPPSRGSSQPRDPIPSPAAPALKADSLVLEPPRKPRIHTITVQQHPCDKGANLWPLCNRTEMATFIKLNVKSLNIPCVYICISIYVCMYFVIYTCIIIYTKHVLHAHIFQGVIYLFSQQ